MPVFTFSGKSASGEKVSGERTAASKEALVAQLRRERIVPGPVRQKGKEFSMPTFGSGKVSTKDIAIFFRQFSVMIDAGLAFGPMSGNSGGEPGKSSFSEDADGSADHGRRRRDAGQRHASISCRL